MGVAYLRQNQRIVDVHEDLIIEKPSNIKFCEAAVIPVTLLTVLYCFNDITRVTNKDRVLIHSAAGGVGYYAVKVALDRKATVYAVCSSIRKKKVLELWGVPSENIILYNNPNDFNKTFDSTRGMFDVILGSLRADETKKNLSLLKPTSGLYIDIGKDNLPISQPTNGRTNYCIVDLNRVFRKQEGDIAALFQVAKPYIEMIALPPISVFPVTELKEALNWISSRKHIGKCVVAYENEQPLLASSTYVISGGGSLGLRIGRHLQQQHSVNIILICRNRSPENEQKIRDVFGSTDGQRLTVLWANVANKDQLFSALDSLPLTVRSSIRGVIHTAGTLKDAVLSQVTRAQLEEVYAPKLAVSNLHHYFSSSSHCPTLRIEHFVVLSSIASTLGLAGQASYGGANAFMDSFVRYRHSLGLTSLALNLGPVGSVGMAVSTEAARAMQERRDALEGIKLLPLEKLLQGIPAVLGASRTLMQLTLANIDWTTPRNLSSYDMMSLPSSSSSASRSPLVSSQGDALAPGKSTTVTQVYLIKLYD